MWFCVMWVWVWVMCAVLLCGVMWCAIDTNVKYLEEVTVAFQE